MGFYSHSVSDNNLVLERRTFMTNSLYFPFSFSGLHPLLVLLSIWSSLSWNVRRCIWAADQLCEMHHQPTLQGSQTLTFQEWLVQMHQKSGLWIQQSAFHWHSWYRWIWDNTFQLFQVFSMTWTLYSKLRQLEWIETISIRLPIDPTILFCTYWHAVKWSNSAQSSSEENYQENMSWDGLCGFLHQSDI